MRIFEWDMGTESTFFEPLSGDLSGQVFQPERLYASESGFSEIWRMRREGRFRVYKVLKPAFRGSSAHESLLRKEFELGYGLDHPGICRVLDWKVLPELGAAIEMEWVDGSTLAELAAQGPLPANEVRRLFEEICDALDYIHRRQLVHRDLKPENVMVTHDGAHVKLLDFGLADADGWYLHKQAAGTPGYAAPEVLAGRLADARSDIYSLGVMLAELGGKPFSRIAVRCTRTLPQQRYQQAGQVRRALGRKPFRGGWTVAAGLVLLVILSWLLYAGSAARRADRIFRDATEMLENALK